MDSTGLASAVGLVLGVLTLVGFANLVDYGFRSMAESKANRAEGLRLLRWGLPSPRGNEASSDSPNDEDHLWHF